MILNFGVPSQRARKEEKYPNQAVVTMTAYKGKGTAKKFEFNKKACEALFLEDGSEVSISFHEGNILIVNTTGQEVENYKVTKGNPRSFSNAKVYEYFTKFLSLSNDVENEFSLEALQETHNNMHIFKLSLMNAEEEFDSVFGEQAIEEREEEERNLPAEIQVEEELN
jgi:hypothetical protein